MREIKFRALRDGTWHILDLTDGQQWTRELLVKIRDDSVKFDTPLLQFTGLKDKNGVEIYEGDILQGTYNYGLYGAELFNDFIGEVEWREEPTLDGGYGSWYIKQNSNQTQPPISIANSAEIIGNIHEHPELLEGIGKKQ